MKVARNRVKDAGVPKHVTRALERLVNTYNKYHSPEATASLERVEPLKPEDDLYLAKVVFRGSFCATCGVRDWVEDLAYLGEPLGVEARLEEMVEPEGSGDERVGYFIVRVPTPPRVGSEVRGSEGGCGER